MKKGFTLVEMSIVLVIIGVLMGLTVKGKQLIDSAKLRADMNKVRNIQIAVAAYLADSNAVFPNNFSTANLTKTLTPEDYTLKTAEQNLSVTQVRTRSTAGTLNTFFSKATSGNEIAVVMGPDNGTVVGSNIVFGCKVDATLDDKIQSTGDTKGYSAAANATVNSNNATIEATDCDARFSTNVPYAMLIY